MRNKCVRVAVLGLGSIWLAAEVLTCAAQTSPLITTQPQSQIVGLGSSVTFEVIAGGAATNFLDGVTFAGDATAQTNILDATANQGTVLVDYDFYMVPDDLRIYYEGSLVFDSGLINGSNSFAVDFGPGSSNFISIVMNEGGANYPNTAWLYTPAILLGALHYQWRKDGIDIPTATNSTYLISASRPSDAGSYSVVVTNTYSTATSSVATLSVTVSLALNTHGNGSASASPDQTNFLVDSQISLAAWPDPGSILESWSGGATGKNNPLTILMRSNTVITAAFASPIALTVQGQGRVGKTPDKLFYEFGEQVSLNAKPNRWFAFTGWGDGLSDNPRLITIGPTNNFTAVFTRTYLLTTTTEGGGTVNLSPPDGLYVANTPVTITATPDPGWTFLQWLGDGNGAGPTNTLLMDREKCVQAVFGTALNTVASGNGSVLRDPMAALYPYGFVVTLTPVPQAGSYFALWGNAASGTDAPLRFTVTNANQTVSALFASLGSGQFALTLIPDGSGQVTANPLTDRYGNNQAVTVTAVPEPDQDFLNWSGDATDSGNPVVVSMTRSKIITAHFTRRPRLAVGTCAEQGPSDSFRLMLTGNLGGVFQIDQTADLTHWIPLITLTNTYGTVQLTDPSLTNQSQRFYRAIPVP